jgi:hypothetical protein
MDSGQDRKSQMTSLPAWSSRCQRRRAQWWSTRRIPSRLPPTRSSLVDSDTTHTFNMQWEITASFVQCSLHPVNVGISHQNTCFAPAYGCEHFSYCNLITSAMAERDSDTRFSTSGFFIKQSHLGP